MSSIKINGQEFKDVQIVKLHKSKADEAIKKLNTSEQGADDVVFKVGEDVFVASGRDLFPGKKAASEPFLGGEGIAVEFDGQKVEVLAWDNQANNGKECAKWAALFGAPTPLGGYLFTRMMNFSNVWAAAVAAASYVGVVTTAYFFGKHREMDTSEIAGLGTVLQKNTQAPGGWKEMFNGLARK